MPAKSTQHASSRYADSGVPICFIDVAIRIAPTSASSAPSLKDLRRTRIYEKCEKAFLLENSTFPVIQLLHLTMTPLHVTLGRHLGGHLVYINEVLASCVRATKPAEDILLPPKATAA